jgi:hypothetical protein
MVRRRSRHEREGGRDKFDVRGEYLPFHFVGGEDPNLLAFVQVALKSPSPFSFPANIVVFAVLTRFHPS